MTLPSYELTDEVFYQYIQEVGEKLCADPSNFSCIRITATALRDAIEKGAVKKYLAQAYTLYLIFLDVLNNIAEDNYVKSETKRSIGQHIGKELLASDSKNLQNLDNRIMSIGSLFCERSAYG